MSSEDTAVYDIIIEPCSGTGQVFFVEILIGSIYPQLDSEICRNCGNVTNRSSFISITMPPMIDPATPLQAHTSLETRPPFRLIPYWKRLPPPVIDLIVTLQTQRPIRA